MADKQYEYYIKHTVTNGTAASVIWFRSTNYDRLSPYGWALLAAGLAASDEQLVAAVKQLGMNDCEFIPASPEVCETMFTHG